MKPLTHKRILILADIEGSSNCHDYDSTTFLGNQWPQACQGMTRDTNAVVKALFKAGIEKIYIKDFHRTGYNLFQSGIDSRAKLISGYFKGPVPGMGTPYDATGVIMLGMHAPSGSDGFLAHTLTSRILKLTVNDTLMSEAQLFAAVLAPYNIKPLFFSGCPIACKHTESEIKHLNCWPIAQTDKQNESARIAWRKKLAEQAVKSLSENPGFVYQPKGIFHAAITFKTNTSLVKKMALNWGYHFEDRTIYIDTKSLEGLYSKLIRLVYLSPLSFKLLPVGLPIYNLMGKMGLAWANWQLKIRAA